MTGHSSGLPPVLLLAFDRPRLVHRQINRLREVAAPQLFISVDGPRRHHPTDEANRRAVLSAIDEIDWPCEVQLQQFDENQGLNAAVTGGIDWFFDHVEAGVILEDDCIPRSEFFAFASDLLTIYSHDESVMMISGLSMQQRPDARNSYLAAPVGHIWGWATWARAWQRYDFELSGWPDRRVAIRRSGPLGRALARKFDAHAAGRKARWARAWHHSLIAADGIALIPSVNLVENQGFGPDATNTAGRHAHPLRRPTDIALRFPLRHPSDLTIDPEYERLLARYHARSLRDRTADRLAAMRRSFVR